MKQRFFGCTAVLALSACVSHTRANPSAGDIRAGAFAVAGSAELNQTGDTARVAIHLHNETSRAATASLGACALDVTIARADGGGSQPAWDQAKWQPFPRAGLQLQRVCLSYLVQIAAPSGATITARELSAHFATRQLLGDSLASGLYRFTARVAFNDTAVVVAIGTLPLRRP